jgi:uncharacterized secreted protein with C-terminal beta-propeller domain
MKPDTEDDAMTTMVRRTRRDGTRVPLGALVAVLAASLALPAVAPAATARKARPSALPAFGSCKSLLGYAHRNARRTGGGTGVQTRAGVISPQVLTTPAPAVATDTAGSPPPPVAAAVPQRSEAGTSSSPSFSSTNVQEAGIDEPDIVKTDGKRVFAIANGKLLALDSAGGSPKLVGSLALEGTGGHQMLIRDDRVLIMTTSYSFGGGGVTADVASSIAPGASAVVLTEIDVSNPAAMTVRRSMQLEGQLVDARLHGGTARVVVGSTPAAVQPQAIPSTGVRRYVPRTTLRSRVSGRTFRRSVVPCDEVRHPRSFSGLDLLTVLTIDLDKGLFNVDRDAIMAGAQTVYGSPTGLYVASQRYVAAVEQGRALPESMRTEIHRFDASKEGVTTYAGSGSVPGFVLNQYSLSEHEGALRVASTEQPQWFQGAIEQESESFVTILGAPGTALETLGRVGGLGKGERIYAVRFVGDNGYVVTFRQVDPLYTLDLSDKRNPKVLGELKILGYSAYLHPVSENLLLGVGQDATEQGRRLGVQLSLFDVSDLRRPVRRAQATLGGFNASTTAEFDPHAFLFWKPANLAVIPLLDYGNFDAATRFQGAVGFRVGSATLAEAGRVTHPAGPNQPFGPPIARSLVIDDKLYTLSWAGLGVSTLDTLAPLAFAAFPAPPPPPPGGPVPLPAPASVPPG